MTPTKDCVSKTSLFASHSSFFSTGMFSTATNRRNSSGYRSARSVRRQHTDGGSITSKLSLTKIMLILIGLFALAMTTILPMILLESSTSNGHASASIHNVLYKSEEELRSLIGRKPNNENVNEKKAEDKKLPFNVPDINKKLSKASNDITKKANKHTEEKQQEIVSLSQEKQKQISKNDAPNNDAIVIANSNNNEKNKQQHQILARGVSGLPMPQTPALEGAEWGHVECDVNVDDMAYWNEPQGTRDQNFVSPFSMQDGDDKQQNSGSKQRQRRYLTFEPDPGGWNNIRMSSK